MTQPLSNPQPVQTVALPDATFPAVMYVLSDRLLPPEETRTIECPHCQKGISFQLPVSSKEVAKPISWIVGQPHPLTSELKVIRMFKVPEGIEVYSVSNDLKSGVRNTIPQHLVRLVNESMPLDVFRDELEAAEADNSFDDDDDGDEETDEPATSAESQTTSNGQTAS